MKCPTNYINSLAPRKFELNFRYVIFQRILVTDGWGISCEIALIWKSLDLTDDQSTLAQVMAWCRQATSHCLSQCWPRSLLPYGVTRPQWVKLHSKQKDRLCPHYSNIIMSVVASQITSLTIVYSTVYSGADQRKHQSSASLAFVRGIHWWPMNSLHKGPVMRKMFPFDDIIKKSLHYGKDTTPTRLNSW